MSIPPPLPPPSDPYGQSSNPYGQPANPYGQPPNPHGQPPNPHGAPGPQPPPPPYGGQQAWYPQAPPPMNTMAIVAFAFAMTCGLVIGLVLGIIALTQIRKRGERGKGLAVAAIAVSGVATLFMGLVITLGLLGHLDEETTRDGNGRVTDSSYSKTEDIAAGDCFNTTDDIKEYEGEGAEASYSVRIVPCVQAHEAEAYGSFDVEQDGSYPGDETLAAEADEKCSVLAEAYAGDLSRLPTGISMFFYYPMADSWSIGDREVTCAFGTENGDTTTGSLKGAGGPVGSEEA